jgi:chondroitin 4-sulfotransferase 11
MSNDWRAETYIHSTALSMKKFFDKNNWPWNDYFKFTFTRNPFDMEVSQYFYTQKRVDEFNALSEEEQNSLSATDQESIFFYKKWYKKSFKEWLARWEYTYNLRSSDYTHDKKYCNLLDFIGKCENLQEDFNAVCDKIGIPQQQLPHKNKSKHKHYTEYYDDETRQIVAEKYAKDIEYFGYEFRQ